MFLFLYLYKADYKRPAIVFLGGIVLIDSHVVASCFIPDLNIVYPDILAYSLAVVMIYLCAFRYGIFDLAPMGRQVMIDGVEDIIITVDPKGKIIDSNKVCTQIFIASTP